MTKRTDTPFEIVQKHLRRFTKLPVLDDGKMPFFRFWDPRVLRPFLTVIAGDAARMRRIMMTDAGKPLHYVFRHGETDIRFSPEAGEMAETPIAPMYLRFADFDPIARARAAERRRRMADQIQADFLPVNWSTGPARLSKRLWNMPCNASRLTASANMPICISLRHGRCSTVRSSRCGTRQAS
ncbi:DUF4123 domain-containing protein [Paracoccus alkanivorans]|uniref:DUF4123 domain-containing protein n=1 Tax=Paracoccus alkanivorans TaxID=2116655 RepID=A0A3M0MEP0_9RHOB|nr:DUF4123 domain-containing protein [Paracoccus alkanivorans]